MKAAGLPVLSLGDSHKARVGDIVAAIGNPLGVGQTVAAGAISAEDRQTGHRPAHRTSERRRRIRAQLLVRSTLVRTRSKYIPLVGALARREGCRIASGGSDNFVKRAEAANLPEHVLASVAPLFESLKMLNRQVAEADADMERMVKEDEVVRRLCTAPGVGPVPATTFASTIDDATRFGAAKQVRSYLGLVPREYSSGERQHRGRISKAGGSRARTLLVEAAWAPLRWRNAKNQALYDWAKKTRRWVHFRLSVKRRLVSSVFIPLVAYHRHTDTVQRVPFTSLFALSFGRSPGCPAQVWVRGRAALLL